MPAGALVCAGRQHARADEFPPPETVLVAEEHVLDQDRFRIDEAKNPTSRRIARSGMARLRYLSFSQYNSLPRTSSARMSSISAASHEPFQLLPIASPIERLERISWQHRNTEAAGPDKTYSSALPNRESEILTKFSP